MSSSLKSVTRGFIGIAACILLFAALSLPSARLYFLTLRETLKSAERLGIMDPKGALGGQVMGFNYQRNPAWVYPTGQVLGAAIAYTPSLIASLLFFHRIAIGPFRSMSWGRCGKCGKSITGATEPRCPSCEAEF